MAAAAGARLPAVAHEFFRAEAHDPCLFVDLLRDADRLAPAARRMQVHLDHAGIGRHLDDGEARIVRRRVAIDVNGQLELRRRCLDRREDAKIIFQRADERHEHAEPAVARLDGERGAHDAVFGRRRWLRIA